MSTDLHQLSGVLMTEAANLVKIDTTVGKAIYVDQDGGLQAITPSHEIRPSGDEVLIKTIYSGIIPADTRHGRMLGIRDTIAGHDFCGEVVRPSTTNRAGLLAGDIVFGVTVSGLGRSTKCGAHQAYLCCPEETILRVPSNLPHQHAAAIGSAIHIAADAVFNLFGLPLPNERSPGSLPPGPMLIWGASTTIGLCVLQFARAAGARHVFVTASQARHALLLAYGATDCFDYNAPDCHHSISMALAIAGCGPFVYVIDCVGNAKMQLSSFAFGSTKLVSVSHQKDPNFAMAQSTSCKAFTYVDPDTSNFAVLTFRPRPAAWDKTRAGVRWAIEHYGQHFALPTVNVFQGTTDEAVEKIERVGVLAEFGRTVLQHPLI